MKKLVVLCGFILTGAFFAQVVFSQKTFLPGYVVTPQGDTLNGSIDYKNWGKNPDSILFRDAVTGQQHLFGAGDIRSMFVNDEYYISAVVGINERINDMDVLVLNFCIFLIVLLLKKPFTLLPIR